MQVNDQLYQIEHFGISTGFVYAVRKAGESASFHKIRIGAFHIEGILSHPE